MSVQRDERRRDDGDPAGRPGWLSLVVALSPLLLIYVGVTLARWPAEGVADEGRYLQFADNLRQGHYALPGDDFLWNGPGYPLILAAWNTTGWPADWARFGNAGFLFLATVFFARLMSLYVPRRWAIGMAWALGLYVPLYIELGLLMTESLAVCLICGAFLAAGVALRTGSRMAIVLAGLFLGYLALTKVFFGYVLLGGLVVYGISAAVAQTHPSLRRMAAIYLIGLLATVPYLVYTYQLTGKVFYWSNCGGLSLYWMSTPYDGEWGDWFHPADVQQRSELARHRPLFDSIADLPAIEKDAALRRHAIDNIASHPAKFLRNVAANISRMWYSFPYSYTPQKLTTLFYAVPGSLLLSTLIIAMVVLYARRPVGVSDCHLTIVFMVLTFAGSAVLSACPRMLEPIVPGAFFLIGLAAHTVWNGRDG